MELVWLPEAREDLERLLEFLLDANPLAAERAARLLRRGAESLRDHPEVGRPMDDDTGRRELVLPFGAAAYVLRYRIHLGRIVIVRVWHGRES